ncbi:MAG: hypothetical protein K6E97_00855 [Treponema sp.]|nr:hypothetical protein [Treponema sp.]
METKYLIMIFAYCIYALSFLMIPLVRRKIEKKAGKMLLQFNIDAEQKSFSVKNILIVIFCAVLIFIVSKIGFKMWLIIVLDLCAVLGNYISLKEISLFGCCGIYENAIINNSYVVFYDEIADFPFLKDKTKTEYSSLTLVILTTAQKQIQLSFNSEAECSMAKNKLRELKVLKY